MERRFVSWNLLIATVISVIMLTGILFGQQRPQQQRPPIPDKEQITKMVDNLATQLSLSDKQKTRMEELHLAHFTKVKSMHQDGKNNNEAQKQTMDAERKKFEKEMESILTPEQREKFKQFRKQHPQPGMQQKRPKNTGKGN